MVLPVSHSSSSAQSSDHVRFDFDNADRRLREKMHPKNTPPAAPHGLMPAAKTSKLILGKGLKRYRYIPLHTNTENSNRWLKIQNNSGFLLLPCTIDRRTAANSVGLPWSSCSTKYATDIICLHQPCCGWYWYGWYCWYCWYWFWFASKFLLAPRSPGRSDFLWRLDHDFATTRDCPPRPRKLLSMQTPLLAQTPWAHWHTLRPGTSSQKKLGIGVTRMSCIIWYYMVNSQTNCIGSGMKWQSASRRIAYDGIWCLTILGARTPIPPKGVDMSAHLVSPRSGLAGTTGSSRLLCTN